LQMEKLVKQIQEVVLVEVVKKQDTSNLVLVVQE